jgi:hypothetical protein
MPGYSQDFVNNFKIKFGGSTSNFIGLKSENKNNLTIGLSYEWFISQPISISAELFYNEKGGLLRNKKVGVNFWEFYVIQDINCSIKYIEVPVLLNYYFPIHNKIKLQIFGGFALALSVSDNTELKTKKEIFMNELSENELNNLKLDYHWNFDPGPFYELQSSTFDINLGIGVFYNRYFIQLKYSQNFNGQIETVYDIYLKENVRTYSILLGYTI